jgi:hypothetical protein
VTASNDGIVSSSSEQLRPLRLQLDEDVIAAAPPPPCVAAGSNAATPSSPHKRLPALTPTENVGGALSPSSVAATTWTLSMEETNDKELRPAFTVPRLQLPTPPSPSSDNAAVVAVPLNDTPTLVRRAATVALPSDDDDGATVVSSSSSSMSRTASAVSAATTLESVRVPYDVQLESFALTMADTFPSIHATIAPLPTFLIDDSLASATSGGGSKAGDDEDDANAAAQATQAGLDALAAQLESAHAPPLDLLFSTLVFPPLLSYANALAPRGAALFQASSSSGGIFADGIGSGSGQKTSLLCFEAHLSALRRYVLMSEGNMMDAFSEKLWGGEAATTRDRPLTGAQVAAALDECGRAHARAIDGAGASSRGGGRAMALHTLAMHHISFHIDPVTRTTAPASDAPDPSSALGSDADYNSLAALRLRYRVGYPLSLLLPEHTLAQYAQVFSFLLQLQRVHDDLRWMWMHMQNNVSWLPHDHIKRSPLSFDVACTH